LASSPLNFWHGFISSEQALALSHSAQDLSGASPLANRVGPSTLEVAAAGATLLDVSGLDLQLKASDRARIEALKAVQARVLMAAL
jgi:hypothetical protein